MHLPKTEPCIFAKKNSSDTANGKNIKKHISPHLISRIYNNHKKYFEKFVYGLKPFLVHLFQQATGT